MTTINGKLVELNLINSDPVKPLTTVYQLEENQEQVLENLQVTVYTLNSRVNDLENDRYTVKDLNKKLEKIEKQTAQKLIAMTLMGTLGFTSLGVWIGISNKASVSAKNTANYLQTNQIENR